MTLTVLQFEPTPGIAREVICETIKPSLRIRGVLLPGQVVVAAPMAAEIAAIGESPLDETVVEELVEETTALEPEVTDDDSSTDGAESDVQAENVEKEL